MKLISFYILYTYFIGIIEFNGSCKGGVINYQKYSFNKVCIWKYYLKFL